MLVVRLSDTCTTGWLHWGHGELWLTPDLLVRIGSAAVTRQAMGRAAGRGVAFGAAGGAFGEIVRGRLQGLTVDDVDDDLWTTSVLADRRALVIRLDDVRTAMVARGIITSRLGVRMGDGKRHKLLWMRNEAVLPVLRRAVTDLPAHREVFTSGWPTA